MWLPTSKKKSFFQMAGGGVLGKEGGIARVLITPAGNTIEVRLLFIVKYPVAGETIIEKDIGADNNGTFNQYLMLKSKGIGEAGKRVIIGRRIKPGVLRICNAKGNRDTRLKGGEEIRLKEGGEIIQIVQMITKEINANQSPLH